MIKSNTKINLGLNLILKILEKNTGAGGTFSEAREGRSLCVEIFIENAPQNISQSVEESRTESTAMAPVSVKRVLISESVDPCCKTILQENGIEVTEKQQMTKEELIAEIQVSDSSTDWLSSSAETSPEYQVPWFESPPANGVLQSSSSNINSVCVIKY